MLGWGIISTGLHPENKIAPAIARADGAELAAVYSRDRLRAEAFAERHGARTAYDDLDAMLADAAVDAVFISSPNSLHAQHGIKAAAAGKHVLVEKPMTTTLEDGVALVQACRSRGSNWGLGSNSGSTLATSRPACRWPKAHWEPSPWLRRSGASACGGKRPRRPAPV